MRIIISPAKKMIVQSDSLACAAKPIFLDKAKQLYQWITAISFEERKALWHCSESVAQKSNLQFETMDLDRCATPALLAYDGIQYDYMAPAVFEDCQIEYVQEHLRILSGFYGVLRPLDCIAPYRLEMQAKGAPGACKDLYDFWGDDIYRELMRGCGDRTILNLASKEYSKALEAYLDPRDRYITIVFGELDSQRIVQKGVYVKMARGEMVRYLSSIQAERPEQIKDFSWSRYGFDESRSDETHYVFLR